MRKTVYWFNINTDTKKTTDIDKAERIKWDCESKGMRLVEHKHVSFDYSTEYFVWTYKD